MKFLALSILSCILLLSCINQINDEASDSELDVELEKSEILQCLNGETSAAFSRDFAAWTQYWVHREDISKTYMNFADSSFSESIGWVEISGFVRDFIRDHPEPEPVPRPLKDVSVRLYDHGAWVTYEQVDSLRGPKREARLMEKHDGEWKIAGMQTTIYGFEQDQ